MIDTIIAPIAKKKRTKEGIKNSAIKKLTPIKNQNKYMLIKFSIFFCQKI